MNYNFYGRGSYPPGWNGWHFNILRIENHNALKNEYFSKAWYEYWLQVGVKRQVGGNPGEMNFR